MCQVSVVLERDAISSVSYIPSTCALPIALQGVVFVVLVGLDQLTIIVWMLFKFDVFPGGSMVICRG